jgi:hypothetical protein
MADACRRLYRTTSKQAGDQLIAASLTQRQAFRSHRVCQHDWRKDFEAIIKETEPYLAAGDGIIAMSNCVGDGFEHSQSIKLRSVNPTSLHRLRSTRATIASHKPAGCCDLLIQWACEIGSVTLVHDILSLGRYLGARIGNSLDVSTLQELLGIEAGKQHSRH